MNVFSEILYYLSIRARLNCKSCFDDWDGFESDVKTDIHTIIKATDSFKLNKSKQRSEPKELLGHKYML